MPQRRLTARAATLTFCHMAAHSARAARRATIPNALSLLRLVGTPALFGLVRLESPAPFLVWYAVLALTDWLDGLLARRWGQTSEFGATLDAVADVAFYGSTAALLWIRFPAYVRPNLALLGVALALYAVLVAYTRTRFGRAILPHTHLSRTAGALAVIAAIACFVTDGTPLIRAVIALYAVSFVEMIAMVVRHGPVSADTRTIIGLATAATPER